MKPVLNYRHPKNKKILVFESNIFIFLSIFFSFTIIKKNWLVFFILTVTSPLGAVKYIKSNIWRVDCMYFL